MIKLKKILLSTLIISTILTASACSNTADTADKKVEVMLVDSWDEARGYCLDIAGGKGENAPLDRGLQAHTCYNYTGGILVDQAFDSALIDKGSFYIPYFDVCMEASSLESGAKLNLAKCSDANTQNFELNAAGQLVTQEMSDLCVTVDSAQKREGRGGAPVHVMRPISLQKCDASASTYQTWKLHSM